MIKLGNSEKKAILTLISMEFYTNKTLKNIYQVKMMS